MHATQRLGLLAIILSAAPLLAADDLPAKVGSAPVAGDDSALLDLPPLPEMPAAPEPAEITKDDLNAARDILEKTLTNAQRVANDAKRGIRSAREAERAALNAAMAKVQFEQVRLALAQKDGADTAEAVEAVNTAQAAARTLESSLAKRELANAQAEVGRLKKLFALGWASKNQIRRAEAAIEKWRERVEAPAPAPKPIPAKVVEPDPHKPAAPRAEQSTKASDIIALPERISGESAPAAPAAPVKAPAKPLFR